MIVVYEAANSIDAHLLRGLLEQRGIHAHINGEYLLGAVGDLPAHGLISVLVPAEQAAEARRVIREFDARNAGIQDFDAAANPEPEPLARFDPAARDTADDAPLPWWMREDEVDWLGTGLLLGFLTFAHLLRGA